MIGSWDDVANLINKELDYEYTESKYRKQYQAFEKMFEANREKILSDDDSYLKELIEQQNELYKIKKQVADQRREYRKLLTYDARAEHLYERLIEAANKLNQERPLNFNETIKTIKNTTSDEGLLVISDIHYGMVTDNIWNKYNTQIAKERLEELVVKVKERIKLHKLSRLHIVLLGDNAHGAIHTGCRVAAEEDTVDQIMQVSELLAQVIVELSKNVNETKVYSTYGNHLRTIQKKRDSVHSDNMEKIIPWWLKARLQNNKDVEIIDSEYHEFIKLNILGYNICATHGDLDSIKDFGITVNTIFSKEYGETIDYTILGDKHHIEEFERLGIENILVRSLCGVDDYANGNRLYSYAGQTFITFNEDGRDATYHIKIKSKGEK